MGESQNQALGSIHRMLNAESIAVVGATPRLQYGGRFLSAALNSSADLRVYPVNPRYDELMGVRCYPELKELPESPDLVAIIVTYDRVMDIMEGCAEVGAGSAIIISAGFAERDVNERRDLQLQLGDFARSSGVRVCGPNCLGVANIHSGIWATSSSRGSGGLTGPIALVSQSGASAFGPFLSRSVDRGIGYSYIVSTGNEADLDCSDFIRYMLKDPHTKVIACFVEGFKDGRKFLEVARQAQEVGKPIVMIKVGRSSLGSEAARSHTAALTGSDSVHDAAFKQYGVIRVEDYDALLEVSQLLAFSPEPMVDGVSVVSHSGGISSLTADKCGQLGLNLPELKPDSRDELDGILKGFGSAANPADVTGFANSESFPRIMEVMANDPEVGTLVVASGMGDSQAQQVIDLREQTSKALAFLWTGSQTAVEGLPMLKEANVPLFYQPESLAKGLGALLQYHRQRRTFLDEHAASVGSAGGSTLTREQEQHAEDLQALGSGPLSEFEAKSLLSRWNIPVARGKTAGTWTEVSGVAHDLGYPVVLKANSPGLLHKTEAGLVDVGIKDQDELRLAYERITSAAGAINPDGLLVEEMVEGGTEVIVGSFRDPHFGPVLLFGMGGTFVELYQDVALRVCPVIEGDVRRMVEEVKGVKLLRGFRGRPLADIDALVDVMLKVSSMATALQDSLVELDINPLLVLPQGQGVKVLDALAVLAS